MKSSKLSIKFRITFWYTLVFSLILALVFFYIYFLSKSYSVHDLQEELKDESADILENLYDKSSRNDILYNADWTKFYDDNVSISLYDKNSSFINGVLPEHFPDSAPHGTEIYYRKRPPSLRSDGSTSKSSLSKPARSCCLNTPVFPPHLHKMEQGH